MLVSVSKSIYKVILFFLAAILFLLISKQSFASTTSTLYPASDGTYTQWNPNSGSNHSAMVDETSCDGNTTFNRETTVGQRDSYNITLSSIPNGATITQIDITPCVSKNTSGGVNTTFDVFYRLNGVNSADAGAYSLSTTTPAVQSTTSFGSLSTAKSGSTTLEVGGVFTAGNRGSKLSQMAVVITYVSPPSVTTSAASSVFQTTATLNSTINPNGVSATANYRYGTSNVPCSSLSNVTSDTSMGSGTSGVSNPRSISSLTANTLYYYCATATNADGTTYGSVLSFTTLPNPPSVTTNAASSIGQTTATFNSTVNPNGASTSAKYRFGTSNISCSSLPNIVGLSDLGSGTTGVSNPYSIATLSANTTYYFCATATNSGGTTNGSVLSFTTLPNAPTVTTNDPTAVFSSTASVSATINPNGASTTGQINYDTSNVACSAMANSTSGVNLGSGSSPVLLNEVLSPLSANTTYYYCAAATNSGGTTYGSVKSFTTNP